MDNKVVQIRRQKLKKTWNRKIKIIAGRLVLFFIVLSVAIWLGIQLFYFCVFHAIRTVTAEMGQLAESTSGKAVILMDENVVRAPGSGELLPIAAEGERLPVGTLVAQLELIPDPAGNSGSIDIRSPSTGIISYHLDGWEGTYDRTSWERVDPYVIFEKLSGNNKTNNAVDEEINQGDPVFKVIDNLSNPYLIVRFPIGYNPHLEMGDLLSLTWAGEGNGKAMVVSINKEGNYTYTVLELKQARPFPCRRTLDLQVMHMLGEGIIIPESALVEKDGETGVYTMSVVGPVYKKVDVIAVLHKEAAVQGISPGAEVVTNPRLAEMINKK